MSDELLTPSEVAGSKLLRRAFGTFATGVTVVTVGGATPHGMTANSFASVSLDPPLVLVCVSRDAIMHQILTEAGTLGISVLGHRQEKVARHFADRWRPLGLAQFGSVEWTPGSVTGAPLIDDAVAHFECRVWRTYDGGDHTIFLSSVVSLRWESTGDVLVFVNGQFRGMTEPAQVPEPSEAAT
ncbi:flavin reductase family protein [Micromonospora sp. PSH03]|uniref:flavin reductase family protein n=1 Tax=Micromonospora TaxID=1873 RepID=UPI001B37107B|nr:MULTISPECIES: flavin reductase family protein [Micromonospora]MBQ0988638.1 flavin reductase [Micromonospora sp. H61]MCG5454816.1 flavin reductase family protein [Micromonospora salmantinae]